MRHVAILASHDTQLIILQGIITILGYCEFRVTYLDYIMYCLIPYLSYVNYRYPHDVNPPSGSY